MLVWFGLWGSMIYIRSGKQVWEWWVFTHAVTPYVTAWKYFILVILISVWVTRISILFVLGISFASFIYNLYINVSKKNLNYYKVWENISFFKTCLLKKVNLGNKENLVQSKGSTKATHMHDQVSYKLYDESKPLEKRVWMYRF